MTLTADNKGRVLLPSAAPGDVLTCHFVLWSLRAFSYLFCYLNG